MARLSMARSARGDRRLNLPLGWRRDGELGERHRRAAGIRVPVLLRGGRKRRQRLVRMPMVEGRMRLYALHGRANGFANRPRFGAEIVLESTHHPRTGFL